MHVHGRPVVSDSATLWSVAHQALLYMEFFRKEYWSRLPFLPPGNLPNPELNLSPAASALLGGFFTTAPGFPDSSAGKESACNA